MLLDAPRFSAHNAPRVKSLTLEHERFSTNVLHSVAVTVIKQKRSSVQELSSQATSSALQSVEHCGPMVAQQSQFSSLR